MLYLLLAAVIAAADQIFKHWIVGNIPLYGSMDFVPGIMGLTYVQNTGASFSMLAGMRWVLLAVTFVCIVGIIIFIFKTDMQSRAGKIAIAAVLGGAVGNAIDRVRFGYVIDMFETLFMDFAIFNVADCFIVVGGIVFCLFYLIDAAKKEKEVKLKTDTEKPRGRMPELERLESARSASERGNGDENAED